MFVQTTSVLLLATCLSSALPSNFELCPTIGHYLLPDNSDCTKFYYCEYGYRRHDVSSCAPGTVFSVENQVCVHPSASNCNQQNPTPQDDNSNQYFDDKEETYPFQIDDRFTLDLGHEIPIEVYPNGCPRPVSKNVQKLLSHETQCDWYYKCADGNKILMTCAVGLCFNSDKQVCDLPSNVNCYISDSVDQSQQQDNENANNIIESGHDSGQHEEDIIIVFENNDVHTKPGENIEETEYNVEETNNNIEESDNNIEETESNIEETDNNIEETNNTNEKNYENYSEQETDKLDNGCPSDFSVHYTLPHEEDCNKYYLCNFGKKITRQCGPGIWYDDKLQICTWPHEANCANSKTAKNERTLQKRWNLWRTWYK